MRLFHSLILVAVILLAGCQSSPVWQMLESAFGNPPEPQSSSLNPALQYLRVTTGKRVAFVALGYEDQHPQGTVEVWYTGQRETLRLQNGRLAGVAGTRSEWRQVRLPVLPAWRELARSREPFTWQRIRDVMPGYRYNVTDHLQVQVIAPPAFSQLVGIAPQSLTWFEEVRLPTLNAGDADNHLPVARYAVEFTADGERVVYAEQCISRDFCFTWQRWRAGQ